MRKRSAFFLIPVQIIAVVAFLPAALADDGEDCKNSKGDRGIQACTRVIEGSQYSPESVMAAYFNRGRKHDRQGENDAAIKDYSKVIAGTQRDWEAYALRGNLYVKTDEYDLAMSDFSKSILIKKTAAVYGARGLLYFLKGDPVRTIQDLDKSIMIDPKLANSYTFRGIAYQTLGKYKPAVSDYRKSLKLKPDKDTAERLRQVEALLAKE